MLIDENIKIMDGKRRAFLTTLGASAVGGCLGNITGFSSSNTTATDGEKRNATENSPDMRMTNDGDSGETNDSHETTIGFAGDTMVGRSLNGVYGKEDVDPATIWGDFKPHLNSLDGVFCNLECCLSNRGERFPNRAYYFRGDPNWAVPALDAGNIRFATLSNNHAMDFGPVALTDTIDELEKGGIENAGTGEIRTKAWDPTTVSVGGLDVAVVSFADEYEVYAASDDRPGIAWAKTDSKNARTRRLVGTAIERAKAATPDLLVVSLHWGENWVERPNDRLVSFGHWLIEQGADLVHGHSAHVVQAVEQYKDGIILHDTGDLVDDFGIKDDLGNDKSYLFEVTVKDGEFEEIRLVPFHIDDGDCRATENQAAWLRKTLRKRSEPFETTYERDGDQLVVQL
jgi:poly-gamma-glutamate capsule biosynthesis protein CapA/YwtB (metallophosphatase superfamily)